MPGQVRQVSKVLAQSLQRLGAVYEEVAAMQVSNTQMWHLPPRYIPDVAGFSCAPTLQAYLTMSADSILNVQNRILCTLSDGGWTTEDEALVKSFFGDRCFGPWALSRPFKREGNLNFFLAESTLLLRPKASAFIFNENEIIAAVQGEEEALRFGLRNLSPEIYAHLTTSPGQIILNFANIFDRMLAWVKKNKPDLLATVEPNLAMLRLYGGEEAVNVFSKFLQVPLQIEERTKDVAQLHYTEETLDELRMMWARCLPPADLYRDLWNRCVPDVMSDIQWIAVWGRGGTYVPPITSERKLHRLFQEFVGWYLAQMRHERKRNGIEESD